MTPLDLAKEKLAIPDLWEKRGWPGQPGKACRVPYREDSRPSGSVFRDGKLFHDFASGETLDAPALLARVEDLDMPEACRRFLAIAGVQPNNADAPADISAPMKPRRTHEPRKREKPNLRPLREPTADELEALAKSRGIMPISCELARILGFLWIATDSDPVTWAITDKERWNCQYRRIDGEPFSIRGQEVKTITERGSWASWPIGIREAAERGTVKRAILCEGSTDFLAAFDLIWNENAAETVQPVAMLGAGGMIPEEAMPYFRQVGDVLVFPDRDPAGTVAAARWEEQLREDGIKVACFDLSGLFRRDGRPVTDLNDICLMEAGERSRLIPVVTAELN